MRRRDTRVPSAVVPSRGEDPSGRDTAVTRQPVAQSQMQRSEEQAAEEAVRVNVLGKIERPEGTESIGKDIRNSLARRGSPWPPKKAAASKPVSSR